MWNILAYNYVICGYTGICTCTGMYIMMYIFLLSTANCLSPTYQDHCQFPLHVQAMDPLQSTHTVPLASTLSTTLLPRPICLVLHHHSCSPQVLLSFNDHFLFYLYAFNQSRTWSGCLYMYCTFSWCLVFLFIQYCVLSVVCLIKENEKQRENF